MSILNRHPGNSDALRRVGATSWGNVLGPLPLSYPPTQVSINKGFLRSGIHWWKSPGSIIFLGWIALSWKALEKAEEPEIKLPTSDGLSEKQESSRKTSISALLIMPKPLTVWITANCGKFFKRWEYQTTWPASWEICMQAKKQQLELDMEQQISSKLGKEPIKTVYCHPAYLTYMQSTSWDILGWMKHKLESRLPGEISITSDMQTIPPLWQKVKKN